MSKKALLVDGNSIMYKAFHASFFSWKKEQESKEKEAEIRGVEFEWPEPNNAIRTFTMMMISLKRQFKDNHILVAFDHKDAKTYRCEYDYYKAGRSKTPDELNIQRSSIFKVLEYLGFEYTENKELEADDIIGILAKKYSNEGIRVNVITGDKDLLQLVDNNVHVYISKKGVSEMIEYNLDNFEELTHGLSPNQIIDLKGIMGDNSDNLPGIRGIGEKGALKLLTEYNNLENIFEHRNELTDSLCSKIEQGYDEGKESKLLATIITDKNLSIEFEQITVNSLESIELSGFLRSKNIFKLADDVEKLEW